MNKKHLNVDAFKLKKTVIEIQRCVFHDVFVKFIEDFNMGVLDKKKKVGVRQCND